MTRVIPQIVNTKTALRAAVQALPDTVKVQALLGLDGDCDFSLRTSESYPFRCTKEDLFLCRRISRNWPSSSRAQQ
jgi:hypothetical protein